MKKTLALLALSLFAAGSALADDAKLVSTGDGVAVVQLDNAAEFKAGAQVRFNGKPATVSAVDGNKLTIKTTNTANLKPGDTVRVNKMAKLGGC